MNDGDLESLLREPAPDEPPNVRPLELPVMSTERPPRSGAPVTRVRPSGATVFFGVALVVLVAFVGVVALTGGRVGPGGTPAAPGAPTPAATAGVAISREAAIAAAQVQSGSDRVIDARVGRIGEFEGGQRTYPADRLVWAITFSGTYPGSCGAAPQPGSTPAPCPPPNTTLTAFVDAATGTWLMSVSPAPALILSSASAPSAAAASPSSPVTGSTLIRGPAEWTVQDADITLPAGWVGLPWTYGKASLQGGVLANWDLAARCPAEPVLSQACLDGVSLAPGQALVFVGVYDGPPQAPSESPGPSPDALVDGLGARLTVTAYPGLSGSVEQRDWMIDVPGSSFEEFRVLAWLGSTEPQLRAAVDGIAKATAFASLHSPLPSGAAVDAAAAAALTKALGTLDASARSAHGSAFYACFPRRSGASATATLTDGPSGPLGWSVPATCSTKIEPTDRQLWRLTLTVEWNAGPGYEAGSMAEQHWLEADGTLASMTGQRGLPQSPDLFGRVMRADAEATALAFAERNGGSGVEVVAVATGMAGNFLGMPESVPPDTSVWAITVAGTFWHSCPLLRPGDTPCPGRQAVRIIVDAETGEAIAEVPVAPAASEQP